MLAELMRLKRCVAMRGTHGKPRRPPWCGPPRRWRPRSDVVNGGIINAYGTNARLGSGDWMVVEVTNPTARSSDCRDGRGGHQCRSRALDFYGDFDRVKAAFQSFVENLRSTALP